MKISKKKCFVVIFLTCLLSIWSLFLYYGSAHGEVLDFTFKNNSIADGYYIIKSQGNSNYSLDVSGGSFNRFSNVQIYKNNSTDAQIWKVKNHKDGYISIYNKNSGLALDVLAAIPQNLQNVQTYYWNKSDAQLWKAVKTNNGYRIESKLNNNFVLDVCGASYQNFSNVDIYLSNDSNAQRWLFEKVEVESSNIPELNLSLNGYTLDQINSGSKETKYKDNDLEIINNGVTQDYSGVEIKGRGNTTWIAPKKPYQIKFEESVNLFELGKAKKWVLLANWYDPSNLENDTAFYSGSLIDMKYAWSGQFINLYVDYEYVGLYYLTHKVEIGKSTVDLDKSDDGVLFEMDFRGPDPGDLSFTSSVFKHKMVLKDSALSSLSEDKALRLFESKWNNFESALKSKNWELVSQLIDVESFAKYTLLYELCGNVDAYATSTFFYRDLVTDKIYCGPPWDYDLGFAMQDWYRTYVYFQGTYKLCSYLNEFPQFRTMMCNLYNNNLFNKKDIILDRIDNLFDKYTNHFIKNNNKWTIGIPDANVEKLKKFISKRFSYLDLYYGNSITIEDGYYSVKSLSGQQIHDVLRIEQTDDGYYRIINCDNGKALDVAGGSVNAGAAICDYEWNQTDAQKWLFAKKDDRLLIISKTTGLVLDVLNNLHLSELNFSNMQSYTLSKKSIDVVDPDENVDYEIVSNIDRGIAFGSNSKQSLTYKSNLINTPSFRFVKNNDGTYLIKDSLSEKFLGVVNGSIANGSNVILEDLKNSNSQKWILKKNGADRFIIINTNSWKCLDIYGASSNVSTKIWQYSINKTNAQIWLNKKSSKADIYQLAKDNISVLDNGLYSIQSCVDKNYVLDVLGGSVAAGANVQLYISNGTGAQKWEVSHDADGFVIIKNTKSQKVLDVCGGDVFSGNNVWQYTGNDSFAQRWIAIKDNGKIKLCSALKPDFVLDLSGGFARNSSNIQVYLTNNSLAQRWSFVPCVKN